MNEFFFFFCISNWSRDETKDKICFYIIYVVCLHLMALTFYAEHKLKVRKIVMLRREQPQRKATHRKGNGRGSALNSQLYVSSSPVVSTPQNPSLIVSTDYLLFEFSANLQQNVSPAAP